MDWITQSKFRNWLLVVLAASNLATVSVIWLQTARPADAPPKEPRMRASESTNLMTKALDLDADQAKRVEATFEARREESKSYNDRLTELKMKLAGEIFTDFPDTLMIGQIATEIGDAQAKVEMIRFRHFRELVSVCTPAQRERLKPIVFEVFGRKPPKEVSPAKKQTREGGEHPEPRGISAEESPEANPAQREAVRPEPRRIEPGPPREGQPGPPSVDEKLSRYSDRLHLTQEQQQAIRKILLGARQQVEERRRRGAPGSGDAQGDKESVRKAEDEGIMSILHEDQKAEFMKMIQNRGKQPPR
jgi:Spy/CpxP family protein refolding chaperone